MIFELNRSCFVGDKGTMSLICMANIALKGRHRLYVCHPEDEAYLKWFEGLGASLQENWRVALDTSISLEALEPAKYSVLVCNDTDQCYDRESLVLDLSAAERLIYEPFKVFVENNGADRDFLLTFSTHAQFNKIRELERANLFSFEHCGGITELPKKVEKYANERRVNYLNCSAVFDSDAPSPDAASKEAIIAKDVCDRHGVFPHVLRRRAIENYLSRDWLNTWVNKSPKSAKSNKKKIFTSYCRLNLEQRSHFHMKRGLKVDQDGIESGDITLYSDVSEEDLCTLNEGFGDSLAGDLYAADWVQNAQTVNDSDAWGEVNGMINEILVRCR
ncbi:hypothetical protein [Rhodovulum sulfidophilum]|uniref:hypothetical protein n=1 Tax=Rhodovulum sulfidophilum TaxID=35806 RepID=UPI00117AF6AD|nr:hypothetical protein [Rhodovulum sulfidophilum]